MPIKHLVLDLDLTCVKAVSKDDIDNGNISSHIVKKMELINMTDILGEKIGTGSVLSLYVYKRPYLKEFIEFAIDYFETISIWSAGKYKYVHNVKELIFDDYPKPMIILTHDDLLVNGNYNAVKDLNKIYSRIKGANETNTIIIDDNSETFKKNQNNGILIPQFCSPENPRDSDFQKNDINLLQLIKFFQLENVKNCEDVRKLNKCCIFTTSIERYNELLKN